MVSVRTWIAAAAALLTGSAAMAAGGNAGWLSTLDRAASAEAQKPAVTVRLAAENRGSRRRRKTAWPWCSSTSPVGTPTG